MALRQEPFLVEEFDYLANQIRDLHEVSRAKNTAYARRCPPPLTVSSKVSTEGASYIRNTERRMPSISKVSELPGRPCLDRIENDVCHRCQVRVLGHPDSQKSRAVFAKLPLTFVVKVDPDGPRTQ